MNSAAFTSDDHLGIEARARVLDILAELNTAWHSFETFEVVRTYDRKGYRNASTFIDPNAAGYGDLKTRITLVLEIDESENASLSTLVDELTEAQLAEARVAAVKELEASQAAAAAAQARLDQLDGAQRRPATGP